MQWTRRLPFCLISCILGDAPLMRDVRHTPPMRLRIMHNGHVHQQNPHWHLWLQRDGSLLGEVIGRQSDFKCIQEFKRQLSDSDTATLFTEAASMRPHFKQREKICLSDDVMIERSGDTE